MRASRLWGSRSCQHVYWMLIGSDGSSSAPRVSAALRRRPLAPRQQLVPGRAVEEHDALQRGQHGAHLVDHRDVVARLERRRGHEHAAPRLLQRVLELVRAIGRVDVDQDHADLGRRVLDQRPLGAVRRPDAEPVALAQAGRASAPGRRGRPRRRARRSCSAAPDGRTPARGDRLARDRALEVGADRLSQQRAGRGPMIHGSGRAHCLESTSGHRWRQCQVQATFAGDVVDLHIARCDVG